MISNRTLAFVAVVLCVVVAGCSSGGGGVDTESASNPDWCQPGDTKNWTNPDTGEELTLTIEGTDTYDGRELCVGVPDGETTSEIDRIEYWHNENGSYARVVTYDEEGNIVEDYEIEGSQSGEGSSPDEDAEDGTDGDESSGEGDDSVAASERCPVGETRQLNPDNPDSPVATAEKIIEGEENSYCKWYWYSETNDGEEFRIEVFTYINEDLPVTAGTIEYNPDGSVRNVFGDPPVDVEEN